MKPVLFFIVVLFTTAAYAQQDTIAESNNVYIMKLEKTSGNKVDGFLKNMNDSLIYYSSQKSKLGSAVSLSDPTIPYSEIQTIRIKRQGAARSGALIGGGIGFGLGLVIGIADGDDPKGSWFAMTAGEKGLALGLTAGCAGAIIGVVVGALSGKKFNIQSQRSNFLELQTFLAKKTKKVNVSY